MAKATSRKTETHTPRPPVVVVLGHVDHGKTTLLDVIRKANVAARESGGITQHVGAYVVAHKNSSITFLDTPGHAAFSAMRSRGAKVADIAILVVAVDDGVKPQTREAIEAIRSANIPFVVALNKIDKNNADVDRTKTELTEAGVLLEGWGGDTPNVEIAAKAGTGIDALLDLIGLVAEVAELQGDATVPAEGVAIEAHRDAQRGVVVTFLVKNGTLHLGDTIVAGAVFGKVKALEDFMGKGTKEATPSTPVVVLGLNDVPDVGDSFHVVSDETAAQQVAQAEATQRAFEVRIAEGEPTVTLQLILKADVVGSLEAIVGELTKLKNPYIAIHIVAAETGGVTESDVKRAATLGATIIGFRVKAHSAIAELAERLGAGVATYDVIYELFDAVREKAQGLLPRTVTREEKGMVDILATFKKDPPRHVIGGRVAKGVVSKGTLFEIERGEKIVGKGEILEVQTQKVVTDEVTAGHECGMLVKMKNGSFAEVGDRIHVFTEQVETPLLAKA